jgi:hypothetical protein
LGGTGRKKNEPPKPAEDAPIKPDKPDHVPATDDDYEDGDFATPKHDRDDGEPL